MSDILQGICFILLFNLDWFFVTIVEIVVLENYGNSNREVFMKKNVFTALEKEEIGEKIAILRKKMGYTQSELGQLFAEFIGRKEPYRYTTVCTWEAGTKLPSEKILYDLANFFCIEPKEFYLDVSSAQHIISQSETSLSQKELEFGKLYDGMPVWCSYERMGNNSFVGKWGIVDATNRCIVFSSNQAVRFSNINFEVYRKPVQFEYSLEAKGHALSPSKVKTKKRVWVEPLGGTYDARQLSKGYGTYNRMNDSVMLDNGLIYPLGMYGVTFLAFSDPCDYDEEKPILSPYN